jgi:hypothetical protein
MYSKLPKHVQASKKDIVDCKHDTTLWQLLCGRLDYLRIHLLLERLSTERGGASKKELLDVAMEMLDLTVFLWVQRDRWWRKGHDYGYVVCHPT